MSSTIKPKSVKTRPALICFGAPGIKLNLKTEEDSPWFNHEIAVHAVKDESPQPVKIFPETYQTLGASGDERTIEPPADGLERDLEVAFKSVFTAPPYLLKLRVGHFLRKFGRIDLSSRFPKVGVPFKVSGEVLSGHTDKKLEGVDVDSFVDDVFFETVQTNAAGVGSVEVTLNSPGKHKVELRVFNPIDDSVTTQSVDLTAFDTDVWEEAKLSINGEVKPKNTPFFLRSGQPNDLELEVQFLDDEELSLDRSGENLGEKMDPDYGAWVRGLNGVYRWKVSQAVARSGVLEFAISSRDIDQHLELRGFMMSPDLTQEVKGLLLDGNAFEDDEVFVRDVPRTITVDYRLDTPAVNYQLTLTPKLLTELQAGDVTVVPVAGKFNTWTVKVSSRSGTLGFSASGNGFTTPVTTHIAKAMSPNLTHEVKGLLVNDSAFGNDVVLLRDVSYTFAVDHQLHSPVPNYQLTLTPNLLAGLQAGDVTVVPVAGRANTWTVKVSRRSGTLKFGLTGAVFTTPVTTSVAKAMSSNLNDEVKVLLNGASIPEAGMDLEQEQAITLTLQYLNGDVLKGVPLALDALLDSPLVAGDIRSVPMLKQPTTTHEWKYTNPAKEGAYRLQVQADKEQSVMIAPVLKLKEQAVFYIVYGHNSEIPVTEISFPIDAPAVTYLALVKSANGVPIVGVRVTSNSPELNPGEQYSVFTNKKGKALVAVHTVNEMFVGKTWVVEVVISLSNGDIKQAIPVKITAPARM